MNTSVAKKPASVMRTYTQQVRDHTAAMTRLQDQYFAALIEGVKRITDALTQVTEPEAESVADKQNAEAPAETPAQAS